MNNDLISREALKTAIDEVHQKDLKINPLWGSIGLNTLNRLIDNAPTVNPEELKPLIDKVVEILPELTDAIIKELPKMVSGKIKCSECSYYTNTFDCIPRPQGEWIEQTEYNGDTYYDCSVCGNSWTTIDGTPWNNGMNFCPNCGAKMKGGAE